MGVIVGASAASYYGYLVYAMYAAFGLCFAVAILYGVGSMLRYFWLHFYEEAITKTNVKREN